MAEAEGTTTTSTAQEANSVASTEAQTTQSQQGQESLLRSDTNLLDWRSTFPDNLRNAGIIKEHHTPESAAKTLVSQAEMIGRGIFIPKAEPGTEEHTAGMQKIYDRLGRPETADKYEFTAPEGRQMDKEIQGRLAKDFYLSGLSQQQVSDVMAAYWRTVEYAENITAAREQESFQEGRNAIRAEFGANAEREMSLAQKFVNHFGAGAFSGKAGAQLWDQMREAKLADGSRLINSPYMVATFAEAMRKLGEGEFLDSGYYQPGQDTLATMNKRKDELTTKRHDRTITSDEDKELGAIFRELARQQAA